MLGIAAARTSFAGASALLRELAGLTVSPKTVERHAEALGREVARDECHVIDPEPCEARTLYLGLDGTGVPARKGEVEGRVDDVIGVLRRHAGTCEEARRDVEYFSTNRARMNYPTFRAMGLCVATGVVEGGCKHIVGTRLKRAGMRWTVAGANAIIALRCTVESNRFDDFRERRASATA